MIAAISQPGIYPGNGDRIDRGRPDPFTPRRPSPVLTVSGAADAKANSLQLDEVFTRAFREADRDTFRVDIQSDEQ